MFEFICDRCGTKNTVNDELVLTWVCPCGKWYDVQKERSK